MDWHADDEIELGPDPVIASLSLGAELFNCDIMRPKEKLSINLPHGSLLVMGPKIQFLEAPLQARGMHNLG